MVFVKIASAAKVGIFLQLIILSMPNTSSDEEVTIATIASAASRSSPVIDISPVPIIATQECASNSASKIHFGSVQFVQVSESNSHKYIPNRSNRTSQNICVKLNRYSVEFQPEEHTSGAGEESEDWAGR